MNENRDAPIVRQRRNPLRVPPHNHHLLCSMFCFHCHRPLACILLGNTWLCIECAIAEAVFRRRTEPLSRQP